MGQPIAVGHQVHGADVDVRPGLVDPRGNQLGSEAQERNLDGPGDPDVVGVLGIRGPVALQLIEGLEGLGDEARLTVSREPVTVPPCSVTA